MAKTSRNDHIKSTHQQICRMQVDLFIHNLRDLWKWHTTDLRHAWNIWFQPSQIYSAQVHDILPHSPVKMEYISLCKPFEQTIFRFWWPLSTSSIQGFFCARTGPDFIQSVYTQGFDQCLVKLSQVWLKLTKWPIRTYSKPSTKSKKSYS